MIYARQSTAKIVTVGPVLDADGVAVTGGVVGDFKLSKNGGAPAALNGSATLTHRHTGFYSLSLTTTDLDTVGTAEVVIDDTVNACPMKEIQVLEEAIYDALFAASANAFQGAAGSTKVTGVVLTDTLTTYTGNTVQTGDSFARLGAPAGATHAADNAAIKVDTAAILVDTGTTLDLRIPAALVGGRMDSSVGAMAANVLTATAINANAINAAKLDPDVTTELQAGLATAAELAKVPKSDGTVAWNATAAAQLQSEANDALVAYDPPTRAEATSDKNEILAQTDDIGVAGAGLTAVPFNPAWITNIENAIWDAVLADHLDSGSTGAALNGAGAAGDPWGTALPGAYGAGTAGKIIGDNINTPLSGIKAKTDLIPATPADETTLVAVKAKTDQMVFTKPNELNVNTQSINDATILGDGTPGNLFRV